MKSSKNKTVQEAKKNKNDEFYTLMEDIEKELQHYETQFKDKVIFCNCDDFKESQFVKYFSDNFEKLQLKSLLATGFSLTGEKTQLFERTKDWIFIKDLEWNWDFRSDESKKLLEQSDIVVTNPPFSLFREYMKQLIEYNKQFIILWNMNAILYKDIFPLIKDNKIWVGYNFNVSMVYKTNYKNELEANKKFVKAKWYNPDEWYLKVPSVCWFTNLNTNIKNNGIVLTEKYSPDNYQKYDNYDAIEVSKIENIPLDYDGIIWVPITFLWKYNPEQFEIVGSNRWVEQDENWIYWRGSYLNRKETYKRIFIRKRNNDT